MIKKKGSKLLAYLQNYLVNVQFLDIAICVSCVHFPKGYITYIFLNVCNVIYHVIWTYLTNCFSFPACPPGSYKMSSRQQECFPCPANSVAEEEGSMVCLCEEDHFRTPLDNPSAPCTRNNNNILALIYVYIFLNYIC